MSDGQRITLRAVTEADDAFLLSVYAGTRAAELDRVPWTAEQKDAFVRMQFDAQKAHYAAQEPGANHDIICSDSKPVGRLYLARRAEGLHILDITVLPQYRNQGIGSFLLRRLQDEAGAAGKPLSIYVENFNPSLPLFWHLGFQTVSEAGFNLLLQWPSAVVSDAPASG